MSAEWRWVNSSSNLVVICKSCRKCYWSSDCVHIIVMDKVIELEDAIKQYTIHLFFFFILPAFGRWHEFWIKYHRLYDPTRFKTPVSSVGQHRDINVKKMLEKKLHSMPDKQIHVDVKDVREVSWPIKTCWLLKRFAPITFSVTKL